MISDREINELYELFDSEIIYQGNQIKAYIDVLEFDDDFGSITEVLKVYLDRMIVKKMKEGEIVDVIFDRNEKNQKENLYSIERIHRVSFDRLVGEIKLVKN